MAFRIFRLVFGVLAALAAGLLTYLGVTEILRITGQEVVAAGDFRGPVFQFMAAVAILGVFYFTLCAQNRVRRVLENIFAIPELTRKIAFTIVLLAIYRVGFWVPIPGLDQQQLTANMKAQQDQPLGRVLETVAIFTGGNLQQSSLFGLGIMPYITAAIIFQLLGTVVPAIERLQKEGEAGRKKIQEYTRYATVLLCLIQGSVWMSGQVRPSMYPQYQGTMFFLLGVLGMTTGTIFLMWLGEQIDEYGIGNGISLLIMAGIVARMPGAIQELLTNAELQLLGSGGQVGVIEILVLVASFVFVVAGAILITQGQRRIPIQQAKQTRGRRVYGGQRHYLPLRVNHGGVMPIIFASSLLMFPSVIFQWLGSLWMNSTWQKIMGRLTEWLYYGQFLHELCYIGLIFFFAYFWTTVQFKPKEMAEQLRDIGSFIPGLRPGRRTAEYLERVMERITYCGAAFLAVIAVIPTVVASALHIPPSMAQYLGGTGLLITVSVTLDLVQRIEAQLVMRNYGGFLGEGARIRGAR